MLYADEWWLAEPFLKGRIHFFKGALGFGNILLSSSNLGPSGFLKKGNTVDIPQK